MTLAELIVALFAWLSLNSPYDPSLARPPMISFVPREAVCAIGNYPKKLCKNKNMGIVAVHDGKIAIFFRYEISNPDNPRFQSTLLHELVHHLQASQAPKMSFACREVEAYRLEEKFQKEYGIPGDSDPMLLMQLKAECG